MRLQLNALRANAPAYVILVAAPVSGRVEIEVRAGWITGGMKLSAPGTELWSRSAPFRSFEHLLMFWTMKTVPSNVLSWKFLKYSRKIAKLKSTP